MTEVETHWFVLLDSYARSTHSCFLAEFFRDQSTEVYFLCFRPVLSACPQDSEQRYECKYIRISLEELKATATRRESGASQKTRATRRHRRSRDPGRRVEHVSETARRRRPREAQRFCPR